MFILTHSKTLNGDSVFTTSDNQSVKVLAIENAIKDVVSLRGKPKLLFVTSCRAIKNDISETWYDPGVAIEEKDKKSDCLGDDEEFDDWVKIPNDSDFVLVSATEKGHKAFCSALNLFKVS